MIKKVLKQIVAGVLCISVITLCAWADTSVKTGDAEGLLTGSHVEFSEENGIITATAFATNGTTAGKNISLIVAEYNSDGILTDAQYSIKWLDPGKRNFLNVSIDSESGAVYKAYLWERSDLIPMAKKASKTPDSSNGLLEGISIDGIEMEGFTSDIKSYTIEVEQGAAVPVVKGITLDNSIYTTTSYEVSDQTATAVVTASVNGISDTYTVTINCKSIDNIANSEFHAIAGTQSSEDFEEDAGADNGMISKADVLTESASSKTYAKRVFTNLHAENPSSYTPGSRVAIDYKASTDNYYNISAVSDDLVGCDYLISSLDTIYTSGTLYKFTLAKPAEVVVISDVDASSALQNYTSHANNGTETFINYVYVTGKFTKIFTAKGITPTYEDAYLYLNASASDAIKEQLASKYASSGLTAADFTGISKWTINAGVAYKYRYSKTYNAGEEVTIPAIEGSTRNAIVVLKPIQQEEKPLVEQITDFNYLVGGMNYQEFCEHIGVTADANIKSTAEIPNNYVLSKFVVGEKLCGNNTRRVISSINSLTDFENCYYIAPDIGIVQDGVTVTQSDSSYVPANDKRWMVSAFTGVSKTVDTGVEVSFDAQAPWFEFTVNSDCEVIVIANDSIIPNFCTAENGWTNSYISGYDMYTATDNNSGNAIKSHHNMYVKQYKAGDKVTFYNEGGKSVSTIPYLTLVKFK